MSENFELELFKFLLQSSDGYKYLSVLTPELFGDGKNKVLFPFVQDFTQKYRKPPSHLELNHLLTKELAKHPRVDEKLSRMLVTHAEKLYHPQAANAAFMRETVLDFAKTQKAKELFKEELPKLESGDISFKNIQKGIRDVINLGELIEDEEDTANGFLLRGYDHNAVDTFVLGHPTYLKKLNSFTARGGFVPPELIVLMGAPKSFKTGNLLNISMGYVQEGLKVFYADFENGAESIRARAKQYLARCPIDALQSHETRKVIQTIARIFNALGGDLYVKSYLHGVHTMRDIEEDIRILKDEHNFVVDMLALDYADHVAPIKPKRDKRLEIQEVYFDIKNVNKRNKIFTITLSQVNKQAVNKPVITIQDFAEDFAKAANADAAFAIAQTEAERKVNLARIIPVMQRMGVPYLGGAAQTCHVKIHYDIQRVEELSYPQVLELLDAATLAKYPELAPSDTDEEGLNDD